MGQESERKTRKFTAILRKVINESSDLSCIGAYFTVSLDGR
jgi:hypothetical protein